MQKKGQLSIFLIIIIGVLLIIGATIYWINKEKKDIIDDNQIDANSITQISDFVSLCIEETGSEAIIKMGQEGRLKPQAAIRSSTESIAYFYYQGTGFFPSDISILEEDISSYISENIEGCLDGLQGFNYPIEAYTDNMDVETSFFEHDAYIRASFPIIVNIGETKKTIDEFSAKIRFSFPGIYEASKEIYMKTEKDPEWIDIDFLNSLPYEVNLVRVNPATLVYEITDEDGFEDSPYLYRFAAKFNIDR